MGRARGSDDLAERGLSCRLVRLNTQPESHREKSGDDLDWSLASSVSQTDVAECRTPTHGELVAIIMKDPSTGT